MKRQFILAHAAARAGALQAVREAPEGLVVEIREQDKTRAMEAKYHAMFGDIARQCQFMGRSWSADDWKRLLVDAFAKTMREAGTPLHHDGQVVPSLDGQGVVQLGVQTRKFWKAEAALFIEYLYAWGAEQGVAWSDPVVMDAYQEWAERRRAA